MLRKDEIKDIIIKKTRCVSLGDMHDMIEITFRGGNGK